MEKQHIDPYPIPVYTFLHDRTRMHACTDTHEVIRLLKKPHTSKLLTTRSADEVLKVCASVRSKLEAGMLRLLLDLKFTGKQVHFYRPEETRSAWKNTDGLEQSFPLPQEVIEYYGSLAELSERVQADPAACHVLDYAVDAVGNRVRIATDAATVPLIEKYVDAVDPVRNPVHNGIEFEGDHMFLKFEEWMRIAGVPRDTEVQQMHVRS